jgi:DNA-directed RNA polymerase subunit RPC12/RpoP
VRSQLDRQPVRLSRKIIANRVIRLQNVRTGVSTTEPSPRGQPRQKAVLFCADCGHESAVGGDWIVHESRDRAVYECPDCDSRITTRPRPAPVSA